MRRDLVRDLSGNETISPSDKREILYAHGVSGQAGVAFRNAEKAKRSIMFHRNKLREELDQQKEEIKHSARSYGPDLTQKQQDEITKAEKAVDEAKTKLEGAVSPAGKKSAEKELKKEKDKLAKAEAGAVNKTDRHIRKIREKLTELSPFFQESTGQEYKIRFYPRDIPPKMTLSVGSGEAKGNVLNQSPKVLGTQEEPSESQDDRQTFVFSKLETALFKLFMLDYK